MERQRDLASRVRQLAPASSASAAITYVERTGHCQLTCGAPENCPPFDRTSLKLASTSLTRDRRRGSRFRCVESARRACWRRLCVRLTFTSAASLIEPREQKQFLQYHDPATHAATGKSRLKFGCFEPIKDCGQNQGLVPNLRLQEKGVLAERGNRNGDCRNPATHRPLNDTTYL